MNDIQAALGLSQLKRLDQYVKRRHEIAAFYDSALKNLPLTTPWQAPSVYSSYHLYPVLVKNSLDSKSQKQVYNELRKSDIAVNLHYTPVHRHPYYENLGFKKDNFPVAEKFHQEAISIPMYATLEEEHQKYVVETLRKKVMIA
jgi:dTDP-4-amino-4,6-dideoxygalactose transaminase